MSGSARFTTPRFLQQILEQDSPRMNHLGARAFSSGRVVRIFHVHTDHLNNTVLAQSLSQPDKILRMLLKVKHLIHPHWIFTFGQAQVGEGVSRNPPDRDEVRGQQEEKSHLPQTLGEAFAAVAHMHLDGSELVDDSDGITQLSATENFENQSAFLVPVNLLE